MSILKVKVETIVGDHRGYCSGSECVDVKTVNKFYLTVREQNENDEKDGENNYNLDEILDFLIENHYLETPEIGGGSGYCSSSLSGLKHDYTRHISLIDVFDRYELSDSINIIEFEKEFEEILLG